MLMGQVRASKELCAVHNCFVETEAKALASASGNNSTGPRAAALNDEALNHCWQQEVF